MSTRASLPATTLRGRRLLLARAAWVIIATLALGLFVASVPGYVSNVIELGRAKWIGAPVEAPAGLVFVFDLLGVLYTTHKRAHFHRRGRETMSIAPTLYRGGASRSATVLGLPLISFGCQQ